MSTIRSGLIGIYIELRELPSGLEPVSLVRKSLGGSECFADVEN